MFSAAAPQPPPSALGHRYACVVVGAGSEFVGCVGVGRIFGYVCGEGCLWGVVCQCIEVIVIPCVLFISFHLWE